MTRPKVDPADRQRTAQACNSCKRRKQKCNGLKPCNTCTKRHLICSYGTTPENVTNLSPTSPKRRMVTAGTASSDNANAAPPVIAWPGTDTQAAHPLDSKDVDHAPKLLPQLAPSASISRNPSPHIRTEPAKADPVKASVQSGVPISTSHDEEAVIYTSSRLLQDPKGRLLYIGESASLSYLQLIRMIVESISGPSPFTMDPQRHRIMENTLSIPSNLPLNNLLPEVATVRILVDAFFVNTNGLIEVFDQGSFLKTVEACYSDPLSVDHSFLCLLHLTLAIGLVLAAPIPGSPEDVIIQKLRAEPIDRAETFYNNAKSLIDPTSEFEDARLWTVQALLLLTVYLLAVAKRNAAYSYFGMAVRFAFAIGIHREETMTIYSSQDQLVMRNLWKSLFVIDRFLAASLGRPISISEDDCSGDTLDPRVNPSPTMVFSTPRNSQYTSSLGLDASVRSCRFIGIILKKVYSTRKISTKLAQEIADNCRRWLESLDPTLDFRNSNPANPSQGIAILHVNLFYCHSIILLTRPFFLFLLNKSQEPGQVGNPQRQGGRMGRFSEACVGASCQTVALVQNARDNHYLPHRNPFVTYYLFAASLVLLSNEYFRLCNNTSAASCINTAVSIMAWSASTDPQARRLLFILTSFRDVVEQKLGRKLASGAQAYSTTTPTTPRADLNTATFTGTAFNAPGASIPGGQGLSAMPNDPSASSPGIIKQSPRPKSAPMAPAENLTAPPRQGNLDALVDLQSLTSTGWKEPSLDGNDSLGETEIEFEALWNWPAHKATGDATMSTGNLGISNGTMPGVQEGGAPIFGMHNQFAP